LYRYTEENLRKSIANNESEVGLYKLHSVDP
jgi:hypothetical protein